MQLKEILIERAVCTSEKEPLVKPLGFKGKNLKELWQTVAAVWCTSGNMGIGLGTQSVLWSDASLFTYFSEAEANALMYTVLDFAAQKVKNKKFRTPIELMDSIFPEVHEYAKSVTENPKLRPTFTLNALVALDNAMWQLYFWENSMTVFFEAIPEQYKQALANRQDSLACVPLVDYNMKLEEVEKLVSEGHFMLKIKIGNDSEGDKGKMLQWDIDRLSDIHKVVGNVITKHTITGKTAYYLDANGKYDSKERLQLLIEHVKKINALDQIILIEEPFPEDSNINVSGLGVCIAADESAHTEKDAVKKIQQGYGAIALKPIAKTLSISLKIAKVAYESNIPCFCADLTVNPILVDWNKNVAARLAPLPGLNIGIIESNGKQNYQNWNEMVSYHPYSTADWIEPINGIFKLSEDFFDESGGIFETPKHYKTLIDAKKD